MSDLYNLVVIVERGLENIPIQEFEKILNKKIDFDILKFKKMSVIILKKLNFEEIIKISYVSRVIHDALILVLISDLEKIDIALKNLEIPFEISRMKLKIITDDKNKVKEISKKISSRIKNFLKEGDMFLIFKLYLVENKIIFGISISENIGKRKYKIISYKDSINPVSINTFLNYLKIPEKVLVIYTKDGTIPIEIGILSKNIPANFWSKKEFYIIKDLNYLTRIDEEFIKSSKIKIFSVDDYSKNILVSKRNALNAMVKDLIFFKRTNIDYLDLLIDKKFSLIIIDLYKREFSNLKNILYSSKNLLEDEGKIVLISKEDILNYLNPILKKINLELFEYKKTIFLKEIKRFYIFKKK